MYIVWCTVLGLNDFILLMSIFVSNARNAMNSAFDHVERKLKLNRERKTCETTIITATYSYNMDVGPGKGGLISQKLKKIFLNECFKTPNQNKRFKGFLFPSWQRKSKSPKGLQVLILQKENEAQSNSQVCECKKPLERRLRCMTKAFITFSVIRDLISGTVRDLGSSTNSWKLQSKFFLLLLLEDN